jgi:hypothetical protein
LSLLEIHEISKKIYIDDVNMFKIDGTKQVPFWRQLFQSLSKLSPELLQEKLLIFEPVTIRLLNSIVILASADIDIFESFNIIKESDEIFDDFFE